MYYLRKLGLDKNSNFLYIMSMICPKQQLMHEWRGATEEVESPIPEMRGLGVARVLLLAEREEGRPKLAPDQIELASIYVPKEHREQGNMRNALREVTRLADQFGVCIILDAIATDNDAEAPSDYELKQIYKTHGFHNAGGWTMRRDPAAP